MVTNYPYFHLSLDHPYALSASSINFLETWYRFAFATVTFNVIEKYDSFQLVMFPAHEGSSPGWNTPGLSLPLPCPSPGGQDIDWGICNNVDIQNLAPCFFFLF